MYEFIYERRRHRGWMIWQPNDVKGPCTVLSIVFIQVHLTICMYLIYPSRYSICTLHYMMYISLFRTPQVPETEKCIQSDVGLYNTGTTCNSDSDEKSPPSSDCKRSGMIK